MKKKVQKSAIMLMAIAVTFTALPLISGDFNAHAAAAKKPAQVRHLRVSVKTANAVTLKWSRVATTGVKGYIVYRYSPVAKKWIKVKTINKASVNTFKNTKLKARTTYKYRVRAFAIHRQYYNTKIKKWVSKKPINEQWRTKKTRTRYVYGKYSNVITATTKKIAAKKVASGATSAVKDTKFKVWMKDSSFDINGRFYDGKVCVFLAGAEAQSSGKVTWTSSNPQVAKISSTWTEEGDRHFVEFDIVDVGKTTITATNYDGQKATAVFTVTDSTEPDPSILSTPEAREVYNVKRKKDWFARSYLLEDQARFLLERSTELACKWVDKTADEATKVYQARIVASELVWEYRRRGLFWDCATVASASETAFILGNVKYETIGAEILKIASEDAYYKYYGEKGISPTHIAEFVWVDGQKYFYDGQFYPLNGLLKWGWD